MDVQKINALLHSAYVPHHYKVRTGDTLQISLPRVPLTRYTEFLKLEKRKQGDVNCFLELASSAPGDGSLLPREIFGRGIHPGKMHIVLSATDALSGREVPGVEPLDITVEVNA